MKEHEKLEALYRHMEELGVPRTTAFPPSWRILWRLGWYVPPPLFVRFWPLAVGTGLAFGVFWGLAMLLISAFFNAVSVTWFSACLAGVCFGLLFAALVRMKASRYNLPPWTEYGGPSGQD